MRSAIKYFGGKGNMSGTILEHFPKDHYDVFVDLFGGSAAILLAQEPQGIVEIYNDLEENVYSLHKVISDPLLFPQFKELCDKALYIEKTRDEYKQDLKKELPIVERAFKFFYVNRLSVNGVGGFSVNCIIRRGMAKSTSDFLSCIDRLQELHDRLSRVIVSNKNAVELLNKYKDSPNVFIYADPPYVHSTRTGFRYKLDYSDNQHNEFLKTIIDAKCKILVSGYNCAEYDVLEDSGNWIKTNFEVKTIDGTRKPKTKVETLWRNYDLPSTTQTTTLF